MRRLLLTAMALLPISAGAEGLLIASIKLLDTAHEAQDQRADHTRRSALMADEIARAMPGSVVPAPAIAKACARETADCLVAALRDRGGDRGLFIVVQKSSTLILQVFASLVDLRQERLIAHKELNFRGDNDAAWRRAGRFLARQLRAAP